MPLASHFIFEDILNLLEQNDTDLLRGCRTFMERYNDDKELVDICNRIIENLKTKDKNELKKVKEELRELINSRQIESSGGTDLWYRERR